MITAKNLVRYGSITLLIVMIVGYGVWISRDLLFGIRLSVTGVTDGMGTTEPILDFGGTARHSKGLLVDGRVVPLSEDGTWTDSIALLPGINHLRVSASDKFGRSVTKEYRVYYNAPEPMTPMEAETEPEIQESSDIPTSEDSPVSQDPQSGI